MRYKFLAGGIIQDSTNKTVLRSAGVSSIFVNDNDLITLQFSGQKEFNCMLSDIISVAGVVPTDIGDAIDKLYAVFPDAPAVTTGANPTVNVGLTAQNGVSSKFMRSDAAPALDQTINPVWTGIHTFGANPTIKSTLPNLNFKSTADNTLGFVNFGDGAANVPSFISAMTSDQLRFTVGIAAAATLTLGNAGQIGLGNPVAFGTSGQVLTSGGPTGAPTWATPAAGVGADNPSATLGLAAVNGSAGTFMRSDAAPALSQGIAPNWTAAHNFTFVSTALAPTIAAKSSAPQIDLWNTGNGADAKRWNMVVLNTNNFQLRSLADDGSTAASNASIALNIFKNGSATQDVQIWANGQMKVKAAATGLTFTHFLETIQNSTATPQAVTALQSGTVFSNKAATANVQFNLPAATVGLTYDFIATEAPLTSKVIIAPNGTDTIKRNATQGAAGATFTSNVEGDYAKLICLVAGQWMLVGDENGDWATP